MGLNARNYREEGNLDDLKVVTLMALPEPGDHRSFENSHS
jgi:hypothetical protein